jgi:hypothetical protein
MPTRGSETNLFLGEAVRSARFARLSRPVHEHGARIVGVTLLVPQRRNPEPPLPSGSTKATGT